MSENYQQISIILDIKRNKLRMYKYLLAQIGNPPFIQFLINIEKGKFAVRGVDKESPGYQTMKIKPLSEMKQKEYEFASKTLVCKLVDAIGIANRNCSYRLCGTLIPTERIAVFPFENIETLN